MKLKKPDEARQYFRTVNARYPQSPDRPQATLLLAQIDLEAKRYGEARAEFELLLKDFASTPRGQKLQATAEDGLIQCLLAVQDYNAAAGRLETAIARLPATDPQRSRNSQPGTQPVPSQGLRPCLHRVFGGIEVP